MDTRPVLITGGGDWCDASADLLEIPIDVNLTAEHAAWRQWYDTEYHPAVKLRDAAPAHAKPPCPKYIHFLDWLRNRGATDSNIETFEDS